MSKALPIGMLLSLASQVQADGLLVDVAQVADKSLVVTLKTAEVAVRAGTADGVLVDDVHMTIGGLTEADLKSPSPALLGRLNVNVHKFAVRISRDWLNGVLERGPFLDGLPLSNVQIHFNDANKSQLLVVASLKGLPLEVTLRTAIEGNLVVVALENIRVGPLPVPGWVRNTVMNLFNVADKVNRPGVTFDKGVTRVDVLKLAPLPLTLQLRRFETAGRYILLEGGEV